MPSDEQTGCEPIFECIQCGECCKGFGGTYVTPEDIAAIAEYIGADPKTFVKDYCQMSGSRPVIAQGEDGYCIFFRDRLCTIHPVKPRMCRAWPYINSVLKDPANWHMMAGSCPGMRTDVSDDCILKVVAREINARES
jgi:hypothetical protein